MAHLIEPHGDISMRKSGCFLEIIFSSLNDKKKKMKTKLKIKHLQNPMKEVTKGSLVYTTEGYGIIHDFQSKNEQITIKLNNSNKMKEFTLNEVFLDVPIRIIVLFSSFKGEENITIPITTTSDEIISKAESYLIGKVDCDINLQVFFKGKDLLRFDNQNLEKLGIIPNSKFFAIPFVGAPFVVSRFQNIEQGWGEGKNCIHAIGFSVNRNIKIKGFGVFLPDDQGPEI